MVDSEFIREVFMDSWLMTHAVSGSTTVGLRQGLRLIDRYGDGQLPCNLPGGWNLYTLNNLDTHFISFMFMRNKNKTYFTHMEQVMKVILSCAFCSAKHSRELSDPHGWGLVDDMEQEFSHCPKHAAIEGFIDSQCPGCVSSWGDCGLWKSFAWAGKRRDLTERELLTIRMGVCPRRVNGTLSVVREDGGTAEVKNIDLSEQSSVEHGAALELAIRNYMVEYP